MSNKISFFLNIILIFLLSCISSNSEELNIVPLEKPILSKELIEKKITQNIIKPKKKPKKKISSKEEITPQEKPKKNIVKEEKTKTKKKIVTEKIKEGLILPKKKPLVVEKKISKAKKKSKYYRKKDFALAKKAITEMEKKKWFKALSISKKAKDKSIYRFIQWKHLLTKGNQASFYDYQQFINNNKNYPIINRLRYLAEHKLSTKKNIA